MRLASLVVSLLALAACGSNADSATSAIATLCTNTGGSVVQTYCSAQPPFAAFSCSNGITGAGICDPLPGESSPSTPECTCPNSQCFDPAKGCILAKH